MEKKAYLTDKRKGVTGCILLTAGFLFIIISRISQDFAHWYSTHIYQWLVNTIGRVMGYFPYSVSEILLYLFVIAFFFAIWNRIWKKKEMLSFFIHLFFLASILFFLYVINCGINYYREPFSESTGIQTKEYTVQELKEVCQWLTEEVNYWSDQVERNEEGIMDISGNLDKEVNESATKAMERLGEIYPELAGFYPKPKGLLFPWILSVQQLSGIYSPFTIEANYNSGMVKYNLPFTACHELSHLRGFMQEEEANFIAFLACRESKESYFRYSGSLTGWIYCMNVLYQADYNSWEEVREKLAPEAEADLRKNSEFWSRYDGRIAEVSNQMNDTYLKANGQGDGVKSYDRMVDLIVAYYQMSQGN